jgi:hypothetical protein
MVGKIRACGDASHPLLSAKHATAQLNNPAIYR